MTADSPETPRPASRFRLLLLCGLLLVGLWLAQAHPYLNVANDSGRYMTLGKALAETGELRLLNDARRPFDTLYPPGFPAVIAFWLQVTGRPPGDVVLLVKVTQLVLLLLALPLFLSLLERARLAFRYRAAALITLACCPAFASYANEVMSEAPFLLLCLASVVLVERDGRASSFRGTGKQGSLSSGEPPDSILLPSRGQVDTTRMPPSSDEGGSRILPSGESVKDLASGSGGKEGGGILPSGERASGWRRILALACAVGAFLIRSAGVSLLLALVVWFWRRFGWKWGLTASVVAVCTVGGWQVRNRRIIANAPPGVHYSSYMEQFTLRDPMRPGAGRIQPNLKGLLLRAYEGFPTYLGMIPRTLLHAMSRRSPGWFTVFYVLAVPMALLMLLGCVVAWRRGLRLSAGFAVLFWVFAAMWPWRDPRFLVPILPFLVLFLFLGLAWCAERFAREERRSAAVAEEAQASTDGQGKPRPYTRDSRGRTTLAIFEGVALGLLLLYFAQVHLTIVRQDRKPLAKGYTFGRTSDEGGFYAACAWLKANAPPSSIVMGRPAYLLYLYTDRVVTQIEPHTNPRVQEIAYMRGNNVHYLVEDAWPWSNTRKYLDPYLSEYGNRWRLVWQDPKGSGVKVWERVAPYEALPPGS
jgi:hypothetical protein